MLYVVKAGGDANATSEAVDTLSEFMLADERRRVLVVSAPGKRPEDELKLTQLLYKAARSNLNRKVIIKQAEQRFRDITGPLGIESKLLDPQFEHLDYILKDFDSNNPSHIDELKFFGERCEQYVVAATINKNLGRKKKRAVVVPPWELGVLLEEDMGMMRFSPASYRHIKRQFEKLGPEDILVTGGFGGYDKFDNLRTLPFGGTDVSAAHIARALSADLYENVKCVDGYANVDPRIVAGSDLEKYATHYDYVFFDEAIEASSGGADVIHADALDPCRGASIKEIPLRVCNITKKDDWETGGTYITDMIESETKNANKFVSKKDGYYLITIEDDSMRHGISHYSSVETALGTRNIPHEHIATSRNSYTIAVHENSLGIDPEEMLATYKKDVESDFRGAKVSIQPYVSMITVVNKIFLEESESMRRPGLLAKASLALANNDINIDFVTQSRERAITFGVGTGSANEGVRSIVKEYYSDSQYLPDLPRAI